MSEILDSVGMADLLSDMRSAVSLDTTINDLDVHAAFMKSPYACFILSWSGVVLLANRRASRDFLPPWLETPDDLKGESFAKLTLHSPGEFATLLKDGAAQGSSTFRMASNRHYPAKSETDFRVSILTTSKNRKMMLMLTQDQLKSAAASVEAMNLRRKDAFDQIEQLKSTNAGLDQLLQSMEAFAQAASHDLRTPISTIMGLVDVFEMKFQDKLPKTALEYLEQMRRAAQQMSNLTNNLLDHARSSTTQIAVEPVSIKSTVNDVVTHLDFIIKDVDGVVELIGDDFEVAADSTFLQILMRNLISNSLKYKAPSRKLLVKVRLERGTDSNRVIVQDNGIGFDQSKAAGIFKPFHRLNSVAEGHGVGLSTCAEVCHRHGWSISAHAVVDVGAAFTVDFPSVREN